MIYFLFPEILVKSLLYMQGIENADGDYIALLDADHQHPPHLLVDMIHAMEEDGYDCATARRVKRERISNQKFYVECFLLYYQLGYWYEVCSWYDGLQTNEEASCLCSCTSS